jgi:DNA-binding transcriptional MerR regulator
LIASAKNFQGENYMTTIYKISEIAKLSGFSIPTLRYYEELELIKPLRDKNNYRIFTKADLDWLFFIQRAKATGMSLETIQIYEKLREQGDKTIPERVELLSQQEKILRMQIEELEEHLDFILKKKQHYSH